MIYKILLVEDDGHIMTINRNKLEKSGYSVLEADTLRAATAILESHTPDLIVLDVMLPDGDGVKWCGEIRGGGGEPPVLFLSAKNETPDILDGFAAGGDDYLTKPYDLNILLARIKVLLEKASRVPQRIKKGSLELNIAAHRAYLNGSDMVLSAKEFGLLLLFMQNEGVTLGAEEIYERVWGQPMVGDNRTLKKCIYSLRDKLTGGGCEYMVNSVYGKGYCFVIEKNTV
ncbi:DNA-binding response regulator [Clostridia bacterium]|nr:DNA-binding response regulator [Clostridia bacterium]